MCVWLLLTLLHITLSWNLGAQARNSFANQSLSAREKHDQIARSLNVRPGSHAPRIIWRLSWRIHSWFLPLLHAFDTARARDFDSSLKCLWCKALASKDTTSPVYDLGIAYDMLPSKSRWIIALPNRIYPRLIHYNIELRTAYLDDAVRQVRADHPDKKIRLITLGAGYDTRSVRFLTKNTIDEAWELDIKDVLDSKMIMLERLKSRRPDCVQPNITSVDLNDVSSLRRTLSEITSDRDSNWHTIFLFEGVLMYLKGEVPDQVLSACASCLQERRQSGSLVFSDFLRGVPTDGDVQTAKNRLAGDGWDLFESSWTVKPGSARHMGRARLISSIPRVMHRFMNAR